MPEQMGAYSEEAERACGTQRLSVPSDGWFAAGCVVMGGTSGSTSADRPMMANNRLEAR
jgi:hypothetical protein